MCAIMGAVGTRTRARIVAVAVAALLLVLAGCSSTSPVSVRRTAVVGAPKLPARRGLPLEEGELRLAVELDPVFLGLEPGPRAEPDEPSMFVPKWQGSLLLGLGVEEWLELGVAATIAPAAWSRPTFEDVPEPPGEPIAVMFGPGLRLNLPLSEKLSLSFTGEVDVAFLPTAEFVDDRATPRDTFLDVRLLPAGLLTLSHRTASWLGVHAFAGLARGARNRAFDVVDAPGTTDPPQLFGYTYAPVGGGVELLTGGTALRVDVFHVFEEVEGFDPGWGVALHAGLRFALWDPEPEEAPESPPAPLRAPPPVERRPPPPTPEEANRDDQA